MTRTEAAQDQRRQVLYREIAEDLFNKIKSGQFAVGDTLPGELELVERYAVSRHTMREALRLLRQLGLIERRAGIGTVVRSATLQQSYLQVVRSPSELLQYPADSRLVVQDVSTVRANQRLARLLQCPNGKHWCHLRGLRQFQTSGTALCWVDLYLVPEYAGIAKQVGRRKQPVYEMVEQKYGERVTTVQVDIRAGTLSAELAKALDAPIGASSLILIRRYFGKEGRPFQISVSEHPADRYNYQLELKRGWESDRSWAIR